MNLIILIIFSILVLSIFISILIIGSYFSSKNPPPYSGPVTRIFIIGDSFTFKNNFPNILQILLGDSYIVNSYCVPRLNLTVAYADDNVKSMIVNGKYDYVVLQDQSARCFMSTKKFEQSTIDFVRLIRSVGSYPVLYEPWAYKSDHADLNHGGKKKKSFCARLYNYNRVPKRAVELCNSDHETTTPEKIQKYTLKEYQSISRKLENIPIIYVGEAWWSLKDQRESILFNICDKKHPNVAGSYFNALIVYKFFTGKDVTNLPTNNITYCADCKSKTNPPGYPKCYDCCYIPHLNPDCDTCKQPLVTLDPDLVKKLQNYAQNFTSE